MSSPPPPPPVLAAAACTRHVDGVAVLAYGQTPGARPAPAVDVDSALLDLSRMRGITGGADLTVIPTMDITRPVDIDLLAQDAPPACRFMFADTAVFGDQPADFHKTTYQAPSVSGLISQGMAAYLDDAQAREMFDGLAQQAHDCAQTTFGQVFVGTVTADADALAIRPGGGCGRDYRRKSMVLAEVTFCAFGESVPDIVMTNLLKDIPG